MVEPRHDGGVHHGGRPDGDARQPARGRRPAGREGGTVTGRVARLARTALSYERGMWRSLGRWMSRRPVVADGGVAFSYAGAITPVLWAFIGVSVIEVSVLHLVLPWETVRLVADVLGIYSVVWMIGMLAAQRVNPHVVETAGLRVRNGMTLDLLVPWEQI